MSLNFYAFRTKKKGENLFIGKVGVDLRPFRSLNLSVVLPNGFFQSFAAVHYQDCVSKFALFES